MVRLDNCLYAAFLGMQSVIFLNKKSFNASNSAYCFLYCNSIQNFSTPEFFRFTSGVLLFK